MRLLTTIGSVDVTGQERAALNKLTMPVRALRGWGSGRLKALRTTPVQRLASRFRRFDSEATK